MRSLHASFYLPFRSFHQPDRGVMAICRFQSNKTTPSSTLLRLTPLAATCHLRLARLDANRAGTDVVVAEIEVLSRNDMSQERIANPCLRMGRGVAQASGGSV